MRAPGLWWSFGVLLLACGSDRYVTFDVGGDSSVSTGGQGGVVVAVPTGGAGGVVTIAPTGGVGGVPEETCLTPCDGDTPLCDESSGRCVQCLSGADCEEGACHPEQRRCVDCVADRDCSAGQVCDLLTSECASACSSSATCSAETPLCHPERRLCVECLIDGDCEDLCHPELGRCVDCLADSDCESETCDLEEWECQGDV